MDKKIPSWMKMYNTCVTLHNHHHNYTIVTTIISLTLMYMSMKGNTKSTHTQQITKGRAENFSVKKDVSFVRAPAVW